MTQTSRSIILCCCCCCCCCRCCCFEGVPLLDCMHLDPSCQMRVTNPYHRRRPHERVIPAHKTELYVNSFIPSTTQLWNTLPQTIKTNPSVSLLRKYLSTNDTMIPIYYYFGTRKEHVKHCRLRLAISDLNYDLFRRHLLEDPTCSCGYPTTFSPL